MELRKHVYRTDVWQDWCPGCGNYGIVTSVYKAFEELGLDPSKTVIVSGIGCSGKIAHFVNVNGVHALHGRAIPFAMGIKIANPELTVVVHGGDGDLLGIGMAHFVALGRRNLDITVVLHNNRVYGLTKGQASPTLPRYAKSRGMVKPNLHDPINTIALALASGYTFVARSYAFLGEHLKEILKRAIMHKGAAFIDVLQPCATYDEIFTPDYYRKHIYRLEEIGWDPEVRSEDEAKTKLVKAIEIANKADDRIPIGIFYINPFVETFEERINRYAKSYLVNPPAKRVIERDGKPLIDREMFRKLFAEYIVSTDTSR
ncbi:pyruvate ferredoxin/flavodoxin oxidoreductase, beta subunit [Ignisphaera aggregans DSM 17230]|uniref:2-oxoacid oxidoreductase (ferredoxin) n=1 Tax=Ignisphaera aggregans (strain DSM 17230 / JCM 13409 / AQ1.S1) TaxID=583356 RepID=E0SQ08_IGNAA|nr:pyruvate ferredoxin/flavodoxin oxidoreductase, beta subunit [Ignisphaera aggregans DSM 17230]